MGNCLTGHNSNREDRHNHHRQRSGRYQAAPPNGPGGGSGGSPTLWLGATGGQVPPNAVRGGHDVSGEPMFVARASHRRALLPGKLVPSLRGAFVAWGGREHFKSQYEVLIGNYDNWVPTSRRNIPREAIQGGISENGEPLFIGRVEWKRAVTIGKVQKSHACLYIPFGGNEYAFDDYDILCF